MKHTLNIPKNLLIILGISFLLLTGCNLMKKKPGWPEITNETKPWTRWWWMGNILEEEELSKAMREYAEAGLGGLEITPIYGVKGHEDQFIKYLSDEWVNKLQFTLKEAKNNNVGIDMATGTGWPFGGPWVTSDDACKYMTYKIYELQGGAKLADTIRFIQIPILRTIGKKVNLKNVKDPVAANDSLQEIAFEQVRFEKPIPLILVMAYNDLGEKINLTENVHNGLLDWIAPDGKWKIYAVFQGWHGKIVERAAPGGEGDVIDHFNKKALDHYLNQFDKAFKGKNISSLRAFFNDSYEVDDAIGEANFTPLLFDEFNKKRGYDLREFLPALFGQDTINHEMILIDYRQTISELLLENFTIPWQQWAKSKEAIIRNQAHGSPANILDLYAAVDIPETEGEDLLKIKMASSASNVTGKKLTSSESATWLKDHFLATLNDTKKNIERYFLGGVNHIFYHGTTFSPSNEPWPGFLFYASVNYAPSNTFWDDFKALNEYITRCQSFLQSTKPDNDLLLYFPFYDRIAIKDGHLLHHFSGSDPRGIHTEFSKVANNLIDQGYSLDFISDQQLQKVTFKDKHIISGGNEYKVIVIPACKYMPIETFNKLIDLAKKGAKIIVHNNLPEDIPGYFNYEKRKEIFTQMKEKINLTTGENDQYMTGQIGKGKFMIGKELKELLSLADVLPEDMILSNIQYIRKKSKNGYTYFIVNQDSAIIEKWVDLNIKGESAVIYNPLNGEFGLSGFRNNEKGNISVYLQLQPGQSCIIETYNRPVQCEKHKYLRSTSFINEIKGPWQLSYIKGGPVLPFRKELSVLESWTILGSDNNKIFSGTGKYECFFHAPTLKADAWLLDLGRVCESARIILNGLELCTLFSYPYQVIIPSDQLKDENSIEILVSNLMANRIIYMDKNELIYKKFYNVNFAAHDRENRGDDGLFTSINWSPLESGLMGPVTLTGINYVEY